jgi:hypothetical protein
MQELRDIKAQKQAELDPRTSYLAEVKQLKNEALEAYKRAEGAIGFKNPQGVYGRLCESMMRTDGSLDSETYNKETLAFVGEYAQALKNGTVTIEQRNRMKDLVQPLVDNIESMANDKLDPNNSEWRSSKAKSHLMAKQTAMALMDMTVGNQGRDVEMTKLLFGNNPDVVADFNSLCNFSGAVLDYTRGNAMKQLPSTTDLQPYVIDDSEKNKSYDVLVERNFGTLGTTALLGKTTFAEFRAARDPQQVAALRTSIQMAMLGPNDPLPEFNVPPPTQQAPTRMQAMVNQALAKNPQVAKAVVESKKPTTVPQGKNPESSNPVAGPSKKHGK